MKHLHAAALLALSVALPAAAADPVVGSWSLVENNVTQDGKTTAIFGENPRGMATFNANGTYMIVITRNDLPKIASDNRLKGTPAENEAVVHGMITHYGTYKVDKDAILFNIQNASFPNWNGTSQKRPYTLSGNELKWTTPGASGGGTAHLTWKRMQ